MEKLAWESYGSTFLNLNAIVEVIIHPFYFSWLDLFFMKNFRYVFTVVACYKFENIMHARSVNKKQSRRTETVNY